MDRYGAERIAEFLRLVDVELASPCAVTLIGGSVVALLYRAGHVTADIDHVPVADPAFQEAVARAQKRLPIKVQSVGIFTAPYSYEDRRVRLELEGLKRLTVLVPERHDLAIMKMARGEAADLDAIEEIHASAKLSLEVLVERQREALGQVIGPVETFRLGFLSAVARLFGERAAAEVEARLTAGS